MGHGIPNSEDEFLLLSSLDLWGFLAKESNSHVAVGIFMPRLDSEPGRCLSASFLIAGEVRKVTGRSVYAVKIKVLLQQPVLKSNPAVRKRNCL